MKETVLLVDDDGEVTQELLEEYDYYVILYENGDKAVEDIHGGLKYSIGIIDLRLKGRFQGTDVIDASKEVNPKIPLICLSGYSFKNPTMADHHIKKASWRDLNLEKVIDAILNDKLIPDQQI